MQTPFVILRRKVIYLIKKVFPFTLMAKNCDYKVLLFLCVATLNNGNWALFAFSSFVCTLKVSPPNLMLVTEPNQILIILLF